MIKEVRRDREKGRKKDREKGRKKDRKREVEKKACFTTIILLITFYKVRCSTHILAKDIIFSSCKSQNEENYFVFVYICPVT